MIGVDKLIAAAKDCAIAKNKQFLDWTYLVLLAETEQPHKK